MRCRRCFSEIPPTSEELQMDRLIPWSVWLCLTMWTTCYGGRGCGDYLFLARKAYGPIRATTLNSCRPISAQSTGSESGVRLTPRRYLYDQWASPPLCLIHGVVDPS